MSFAPSTQKQFCIVMAMLMALFLAACENPPSGIETVIVSTLAGGGEDPADEWGSTAQFRYPGGIAIDAAGTLYVADTDKNRIRKVTPKGEISTFAGHGATGSLTLPVGIVIDKMGNLYVAETFSYCISKVTPRGEVSTLVGDREDGELFADGDSSVARFHEPTGIVLDETGNLYVTDTGNHRIRKVTREGEVSTLAGGERGYADGLGSAARFDLPTGITMDAEGNLYVADTFNHRIRKITPRGEVSTLAGGGLSGYEKGSFADGEGQNARFNEPHGIAIDAMGNLYVTDSWNHRIRKVTPRGKVSTLAGSGATGPYTRGFADGEGQNAQFTYPTGIAIDAAGNLYVADTWNSLIRKISFQRP